MKLLLISLNFKDQFIQDIHEYAGTHRYTLCLTNYSYALTVSNSFTLRYSDDKKKSDHLLGLLRCSVEHCSRQNNFEKKAFKFVFCIRTPTASISVFFLVLWNDLPVI